MILIKEDSLKTMCLNIIVCNIEQYILQQSKWDDPENTKEPTNIDFLRQWYSDYLHSSLRKRGKIINLKILNFLLTPHWKKVRIYSCASELSFYEKLKVVGPEITFLSLKHVSLSPTLLNAILCCVPNILYLNLCGTFCNDTNLNVISKTCKKLKMLNLFESNVTDAGFTALMNGSNQTNFSDLQALNLEGTCVTEHCIPQILSYFKSLLHFNYFDFSSVMHKYFLLKILSEDCRFNLKSFIHNRPSRLPFPAKLVNIMSIINLWTRWCPQTTRIFIFECVSQNLLELLSSFKHLEALHFSNSDMYSRESYIDFTDSRFFQLRASQLTSLTLDCSVISAKAILDSCINLKYLSLYSVAFKDEDISAEYMNETKLVKLESFKLMNVDIQNEVYKSLKLILHFAKYLITLGLRYTTNINEELIAWTLKLPNLKELDFTGCKLQSNWLFLVFNSKTIKVIHTSDNHIFSEHEQRMIYVYDNQDENTLGWRVSYNSYDVNQDRSAFSWNDNEVIMDDISR